MNRELVIGGVYRHFKGNEYKVLCIALDSEETKKIVIYEALYDKGQIWARDYDEFMSKVDKIKYPEVKCEYRFELIEKKEILWNIGDLVVVKMK